MTADRLRTFSPPPGLARSAPRDVRLTSGGRALMALAWLLAAAAIVAGGLLYREALSRAALESALDQQGATTIAMIDRLWRKSGDGKPAYAAFHFDVSGKRIHGEARMQLDAWRQVRLGSTVRVRYLPEDPDRWVIDGARTNRLPFGVAYIVSAVLASLALLCAFAIRRQRSLLMEGRLAPAVVTAITKTKGSHGETHRQITYEFPLLGGGVVTGKASASKTSVVGARLCVVYDPDRPARNHPYPFSLVTPDQS
jgi:hypothetical protein